MAGDPAADGRGGGGGHGSSAGKGPRSSSRHHLFRDRAKTRVDDLQEMFSGLQSARKESRTADAVLLEEQVHHMLLEWRAELSVASPASSLQNSQSQGNGRAASDPPSETLRLLQLALTEEEDDATSKLLVPQSPLRMPSPHQSQGHGHGHGQGGDNLNPEPQGEAEAVAGGAAESVVTQSPLSVQLFHQSHGHGQDGQGVDLDLQGEAVTGGAGAAQQSLDQGMQGHCGGEVGDVTNSMFHDQMYYIGHELTIDDFLRDDDYKLTLPGSNSDGHNNLQGLGQMEHEQFNLPLDLQPSNPYADVASCVPNSGDVFFHMSDLLTTMCASPSDYLGPKCALWDCGRPVRGTDECQDYCDPYHAGLALNDDGLLGTRPVMRPRGIDLKDGPLFAALSAKIQGKNVGIPVCEGAATTKSPWNVPELFDLSLLEGESLREWLFFDRPRRAFDSGNRKQRSLPDYSGRGWHESRKQVMKDFGGLKRSYYMDPQPSSNYEWHLFEYEINDADTVALYRLEFKSSDGKRSVKSKLAISPLNELQQQMVKLSADSPENKRTARSRPKATQKDNNVNTSSALNTPNQVSASNAYHTSTLNTPNQVSGSNAYQAMSLNTPDQVSVSNAYQTMSLNTPDQASGSNAYQTASQVDQMTCLNENVVYGPQLPYENVVYGPQLPYENVVYGPQLPYGYPNQRSDFHWNPSDGT